jgi:FKBP-type peptidyl-prolyl cis-trans isomerase 2
MEFSRLGQRRFFYSLEKKGRSDSHLSTANLRAQKGDTVSVHYVGKYVGGQVFDTSIESEAKKSGMYSPARDYKPLQVKLGGGQVIAGFEEALLGMAINEEKEVTLPPEKAYGKKGNHPMSGKTLVFKLRVTNIKR